MKKILVILLLSTLISCSKNNPKQQSLGHICNYPSCPFKAQITWQEKGCGACEKGSDCYTLDSLHFVYPNKNYEQLEEILFNN